MDEARAAGETQRLGRELLLLVLLSLLWGGSFTLIKVAVESVPPATIVLARVVVAAVVLLAVARLRGLSIPSGGGLWAGFLLQGILQSALPFTLVSWGETRIASGLAGLLNATPPLFVFLISAVVLRRGRALGRQSAGLALGFAGVMLIMGVEALDGIGEQVPAQLAVTGASVSYALAALNGRRFIGLPPLVTAACAMTMASVTMLPLALVLERPWTLSPTAQAIAALAALALLSTAFAMILFFRLLRSLGSLGTTSGSYLRAGFSVLLGVVFLGESVSWPMAAGLGLILAGVALVNRPPSGPTGREARRRLSSPEPAAAPTSRWPRSFRRRGASRP